MKNHNLTKAGVIIGLLFFLIQVQAQLELPYNSNLLYGTLTNPAHVERDSNFQFVFLNRDQWNGVQSAPKSQVIGASIPLSQTSNIGTNIFRNAAGVSEKFSFDIFYNYNIRLNEANLRLGILASMQQERRDFTKESILLNDPLSSDALLAEGIYNYSSFNTGIGLLYEKGNYNLGISIPRLLPTRLGLFGSESISNNTPVFAYVNAKFRVKRGMYLRNRLNLQFDSNQYSQLQYYLGFDYKSNLETGVQLNSQITDGFNLQSIDFIVALAIHESFSLGLSYSVPLNPINQISPGTFEVMLYYLINTSN